MFHSLSALIILFISYLVWRYLKLPHLFKTVLSHGSSDNSIEIYWQRLISSLFYGLLPLVIIWTTGSEPESFGISFNKKGVTLLSGMMIGIVLTGAVIFNYRKPGNLKDFPQIRKERWSLSTAVMSSATWIIYLFAYELFFRGYLLFSLNGYLGKWPAIAVNIILYSLVHYHKGWKETAGAIPLGFVLCLMCLMTGNFAAAFIAHVFLALSNEWLSLWAHPSINLARKSNKLMNIN